MKIELKSREQSSYKLLCSSAGQTQNSAELIIPDTMEDIQRILCCRHQCRIREKNVRSDCVSVSGETDVSILYIPEGGDGVRAVGITVPFEVNLDAPGADSTSNAITHLASVSVDAKAANPRKISVSVTVDMQQTTYKYADFAWCQTPENAPDKLFFRSSSAKYKSIVLAGEKTLSIEDELDLPDELNGADFVRAFSSVTMEGSEVVGTKLVVKGTAAIEALYILSDTLKTAQFTLPFSQLFNLPDGCTEIEVSAEAMITGQFFESYNGKLSAEVRAAVQIVCTQDSSIEYISDAYSCRHVLEAGYEDVSLISSMREDTEKCDVKLSYNSDYAVTGIVFAKASALPAEISDDAVIIPIIAEVVYSDREGALRSCRVRGKAELEISERPDCVKVESVMTSARSEQDAVIINAIVTASCRYVSFESISMLSRLEETETELDRPDASLYMCRCADGDLWALAKKYGSDLELIRQINGIDEPVPQDRLLLIPVV